MNGMDCRWWKRCRLSIPGVTVAWTLLSAPAWSADCQAMLKGFLDTEPAGSSIYLSMVTLNRLNVASYAESRLYYQVPVPIAIDRRQPGRFATVPAYSLGIDNPKFDFAARNQVFSDRLDLGKKIPDAPIGLHHRGVQKFDELRPDSVGFEITDTNPVRVTVILRSWNEAKATFTPSCEDVGFMYGSTPDVKYIIRLQRWPPPH